MDKPSTKNWDPHCPKCQQELQRLLELAEGVYDEVDHGGALYRLPLPECRHREGEHGS
jgi:hypothetical protein